MESVPAVFDQLYTYAWFVGFAVALVTHTALMALLPHGSFTPPARRA